ncbi:MAG: hypothetical protein A2086_07045 [Spirochaetes bacterium GWD1_27_9]|nr:MAG: hypothetical protein A2Z98_15675 [Spirochaetes bacterium GWB1_27_13]OHD26404.1 MAG: hypothetical protein A2Y34_14900 [Spirochaetes bacterium GWC1_27_15]OHD44453.1 MAG: hypothetical protein A2086_07045 [Spirochaetes bacterium GWD1_27_9]
MKLRFFSLILLVFVSCDFIDFGGMFVSSQIDDRFREKDSLKNFNPPQITDTNNFSFLVISDTHYYKTQLNYIKDIENNKNNWNISFIVINGDIVQNGLKEAFNLVKEDIAQTTLPIYPVIGNHDVYFNGFDTYKEVFGRTIYDFKIGETHLIFLDTANGTLGEGQKNYLIDTLKNSTAKNKIVFTHYSFIDKEVESATSVSNLEESYFIFDLFEKYKVNYCITGHLHFSDYKEIRGTKYIIVNNRGGDSNYYLKISVKNGILEHIVF